MDSNKIEEQKDAVLIDVNNCFVDQEEGGMAGLYLNLVRELQSVNDKRKDSSSITFKGRNGKFSIICHKDDKVAFLGHFNKISTAEIEVKEVPVLTVKLSKANKLRA